MSEFCLGVSPTQQHLVGTVSDIEAVKGDGFRGTELCLSIVMVPQPRLVDSFGKMRC